MRMECGRYDRKLDPAGWWVSEKLDGWGAVWDGFALLTRKGRPFPCVPPWFVAGLPAGVALDCEVHAGHGGLAKVQAATAATVEHEWGDDRRWRELELAVFDVITDAPFEERVGSFIGTHSTAGGNLSDIAAGTWSENHDETHVHGVIYTQVTDRAGLALLLRQVNDLGGEGLVITRPGSAYNSGRSKDRLKVKSKWDSEYLVVNHGHDDTGLITHIVIEAEGGRQGKQVKGVSPADPPEIGSLVTIRSEGFTTYGLPRFGVVVGVRTSERGPSRLVCPVS